MIQPLPASPTHRRAGRVIVRDPAGAVLLCHASNEHGGWWFVPGGGVDGGESARAAARRELSEETGLVVDLPADPVLHRRARFDFLGHPVEQFESFWQVRLTTRPAVSPVHLEDYEVESLDDWRWCTLRELDRLDDPLHPTCLPDLLDQLGRDDVPATPWIEEHLVADEPAVVRRPATGRQLPWWTGPAWTA